MVDPLPVPGGIAPLPTQPFTLPMQAHGDAQLGTEQVRLGQHDGEPVAHRVGVGMSGRKSPGISAIALLLSTRARLTTGTYGPLTGSK
jgi:hypothetical protein